MEGVIVRKEMLRPGLLLNIHNSFLEPTLCGWKETSLRLYKSHQKCSKIKDLYTINPFVIFAIPNDSFEFRVEDGHPSWILVGKLRSC